MRAMLQTTTVCLVLAACSTALADNQMPWQPDLETAKRVAAQSNRLVLIHFWAPWCRPCMRMEQDVFSKPETAKALEANFVLVKLNADDAPGTARLYGVSSLPSDVITLPNGRLVSQLQSPPTASQYVQMMNRAADGHRALARRQSTEVSAVGAPLGVPQADAVPPAAIGPQASSASAPPAVNVAEAAAPTAQPAGGDPYADFFPTAQTASTAPPSAVTPAQAYAPPTAPMQPVTQAGPVDPYAQPAAPAADPYAAAPVTATAAPPVNPYAAPMTPPAADHYATASAPANPYAAPSTAPPVASPYAPAPQTPAPQASAAVYQPQMNLPQLPPGCPPVALDGNCAVTLVERKRYAVGHTSFGAVHRGRTYLFLGPQERDKFLADPDRFSPVLSGLDPVHAIDSQQSVPGKREYGVFGADGRIYLFADEASRARFEQNEQHYTAAVSQAQGQPTYQAMRPAP